MFKYLLSLSLLTVCNVYCSEYELLRNEPAAKPSLANSQQIDNNSIDFVKKCLTESYEQTSTREDKAEAALSLGKFYHREAPEPHKDNHKAMELYKEAGDNGNASGYCFLGQLYESGRSIKQIGLRQSLAKAFEWYYKGAKLDNEYCENKVSAHEKLSLEGNIES